MMILILSLQEPITKKRRGKNPHFLTNAFKKEELIQNRHTFHEGGANKIV